ncbi:MAG TPA: isoleucine--tRNA ligase [Caulobacteraceae bacterium]
MADDAKPPRDDYRDTVFLPDTPFPMRAGLPKLEPEILERWRVQDLFALIRKTRQAAGAPLFVLHDGPPYANGAIHIGHALNKTLKDFVVRSRFLLGFDVDYVPGWDCHGLPIEWKIEEQYRAKGRRKDEVPVAEFRARCRAFAGKWIDLQREEFKRLGVLGRWSAPYATMDFPTEAAIVREFHKFLMSGQLYRGSKPVMWSPVERTALAEAEVEYYDHASPTIWVKFPVVQVIGSNAEEARARGDLMKGASVVIWTTTPWTIPGNRAVAYSPGITYGLYEVEAIEADLAFEPWAKPGDRLIVAEKLSETVRQAARIASWRLVQTIDPDGMMFAHPFRGMDAYYDFNVPLLAGDHVTEDAGTGFVHTAPSHGSEDYLVWLASGRRDIPEMVDPDGAYYPHVPLFAGLKVLETEGKKAGRFGPANNAVIDKLIEAGALLARGRLEHSYPHSWRSKAPVIFRNTPQWFIRMDETLQDGGTLRGRALKAIDATRFYPPAGRNRIRSMVETRPDWLISRQRAWGTPLAMFVDKTTGEPLRDPAVNARIVEAIEKIGADAWFTTDPAEFLGSGRNPSDYEKIEDILDVWFDSGSTHAFTIENRPDSRWPADLYLEGSDQHRGWFQSSLLESCGTRGRAPYNGVLTHGFTLSEQGEKMSKSGGNAVEPDVIIRESGAEILRLWAAMVDYAEDQRIGKTILQTTVDAYRKLRNTVRYLLGGLNGFSEAERVGLEDMPPLERFVLHRLWELDGQVKAAYESYRFQDVWRPIADFCGAELSAFYFDIRKDVLYCDPPSSLRRRACRTVMDLAFERLTAWLQPLTPFTMEEAWTTRFPEAGSNCLRTWPQTPAGWRNDTEAERWAKVQVVLEAVTGALEVERREKRIGSALEAAPRVWVQDPDLLNAFDGADPAEVFRTSGATLQVGEGPKEASRLPESPSVAVMPLKAAGCKCGRCWRILPEVKADGALCLRCEAALAAHD